MSLSVYFGNPLCNCNAKYLKISRNEKSNHPGVVGSATRRRSEKISFQPTTLPLLLKFWKFRNSILPWTAGSVHVKDFFSAKIQVNSRICIQKELKSLLFLYIFNIKLFCLYIFLVCCVVVLQVVVVHKLHQTASNSIFNSIFMSQQVYLIQFNFRYHDMFATHLIFFVSFIAVGYATTGVDVSQRTSLSSWQCVRNYGYEFAIVRVYQSNGVCDTNGPSNINDAWNAGFKHVDGYIFPCYSCGNPGGQVDAKHCECLKLFFYIFLLFFCYRLMPRLITSHRTV